MARTRSMFVAVALGAVLLLAAPHAGAGLVPTLTGEAACNTDSGEYDVVFTQTTAAEFDAAAITVDTYQVDGADMAPPVFEPNPIPPAGESTATVTVPGSTTSILLETTITWGGQFTSESTLEIALDTDCEPAPTTTGETTTTEAPAARPLELQPAFTG